MRETRIFLGIASRSIRALVIWNPGVRFGLLFVGESPIVRVGTAKYGNNYFTSERAAWFA
jgi:hypothetical protein